MIVPGESLKLTVLPSCVSGCLLVAISPKEPSRAWSFDVYGKQMEKKKLPLRMHLLQQVVQIQRNNYFVL